ncbi:MAG: hypothetical protein NVSMB57_12880 [Actinomycetota bacterium]
MKILHVARYGSVKGGTEAYVRELIRGQQDAGHDVALAYRFDPDDSRTEVRDGVQLSSITSGGAAPSAVEASEVVRVMTSMSPDMVHIHNFEAAWLPGFAARFAPVVSGIHDHRLDCPTGTRYWTAWNRVCDIGPGARCLGYNVAAHCGSLKANATLEPYLRWRRLRAAATNGPEIQVFSQFMANALARAGVRAPVSVTPYPAPGLPLHADPPVTRAYPIVFATGRITKEKGFDLLIDALFTVKTPVHLAIAGDGHHARTLRAREVPQPHTIEHLGWVSSETLASWYRAATVMAVPSAWPEPFGIVGLEAMSAAKPVVATRVGGISEWLRDGVTGIAVPPQDAHALGRAIQSLLDDPATRDRMGQAGESLVREQFSLNAHLERVEQMYEQARRGWEKAA